jgi:hypothetical protein
MPSIRRNCGGVRLVELKHHINEPGFAEVAAGRLQSLMRRKRLVVYLALGLKASVAAGALR